MSATGPGSGPDAVSVVLTSCGRFDLLDRTLASFLRHNTHPIAQFLIAEDSGAEQVHGVLARHPFPFEVLVNDPPVGQIASIARAYARVTSPWVFHCEDDWPFTRPGFIEPSLGILKAHPEVSVVNVVCRGVLEQMDAALDRCPVLDHRGTPFRIIPPEADPLWFGYSFNPGLRRTAELRGLGDLRAIGHECDLSRHFKARGMTMAVLDEGAALHLGEGRHVADPVFPITRSQALLAWLRQQRNPT
jgi:hypothetical protein